MATKAASTKSSESRRKLAFIVGIENYENCPSLRNPVNDANAMESILKPLGFTVTKLLNSTSLEFKNVLNKFENEIQENDIVLFYFSGHGTQWDGQNYLIPQDISGLSVQDLKKKAINAQKALDSLSDMEPFAIIFLLDCCRSYPLVTPDENKSLSRTPGTSSRGLQAMQMAGTLIAYACAPGTIANDGDKQSNGLFTKHLLEHIKSRDDILTILCNVTGGVRQESKDQQIPYLSVSLSEKIYFLEKELTPLIKSEHISNIVKIPDNDLKLDDEIGHGAFGIVYRARWLSQDQDVAVKRLHLTQLDKQSEKTFFEELLVLHKLRHPHIINLYGACLDSGKYSVVMEYMSLGSLYQVLHRDKLPLKWSDRLSIALQTAKGTNYLHNLQPPIFHRDIKSLNILLNPTHDGYIVKLCDFGLAEIRHETTQRSLVPQTLPCTLQWTAPEILKMKTYTEKSDIYSLGIVFWEIVTNEIPYGQSKPDIICAFVLRGDRLEIPVTAQPSFSSLIQNCWAHDPKDRPTCSQVIEAIQCCAQTEECTASKRDDTNTLDSNEISSGTNSQSSASASATSTEKEASSTSATGENMSNMSIRSSSVHKVPTPSPNRDITSAKSLAENKDARTDSNMQESLSQIRPIMKEMYELSEYTTPRYFFIIPAPHCDAQLANSKQNLTQIHYKLYFLCECSHDPREMHVAAHDGYSIKRPKEFVTNYASYLRVTLKILEILLHVDGFVFPQFDNGSSTSERYNNLKRQLSLVESLINKFDNRDINASASSTQSITSRGTTLRFEQLQELEEYIERVDENGSLGNLYRTITSDGHVRWTCEQHYDEISSMEKYITVLKSMNSKFDKKTKEAIVTGTKLSRDNIMMLCEALSHGFNIVKLVFENCSISDTDLDKLFDVVINHSSIRCLCIKTLTVEVSKVLRKSNYTCQYMITDLSTQRMKVSFSSLNQEGNTRLFTRLLLKNKMCRQLSFEPNDILWNESDFRRCLDENSILRMLEIKHCNNADILNMIFGLKKSVARYVKLSYSLNERSTFLAFCELLKKSQMLHEIDLIDEEGFQDEISIECLLNTLKNHRSVKYLKLHIRNIQPSSRTETQLIQSLRNDEFISHLCISKSVVSNELNEAFIHAIQYHKTLSHLKFYNSEMAADNKAKLQSLYDIGSLKLLAFYEEPRWLLLRDKIKEGPPRGKST